MLKEVEKYILEKGIYLYPEIAGKQGNLGSLEDIIAMCKGVRNVFPCLDLAHLHARNNGSLNVTEDYEKLFKTIKVELGESALKNLHIHMYPVDYGPKGEKSHKAFADVVEEHEQLNFDSSISIRKKYMPRYEPLLETIVKMKLFPTIICEAEDSQDIGAREMKKYY